MDYLKFLAVASVMAMSMASAVQAQDAEDCDAAAATESLEDDCIPVIPDPTGLAATNLGFIIPVVTTVLVAGLAAAGGDGGSTPDTQ
jgi:hypothetical protein